MRVLVCGSRNWTNALAIEHRLVGLPEGTVIIHGATRGADSIAGSIARECCGLWEEPYSADWSRYGKAAGPIRNQQMLDQGRPDLVIAFHADLSKSKGTADMVRRAKKAGIPVEVISG